MQNLQHRLGYPARLLRTVRHLRAGQVINRISRKFQSVDVIGGGPTPGLRSSKSSWKNGPGRRPNMLSPTRFRFIGKDAEVNTAADWNGPDRAKLWLYNLHYFDDLRAEGATERSQWHRDLIGRWLIENPVGTGNGWEPYPTSLRIVNWIAWVLAGNDPDGGVVESLAVQARLLNARLEFHLLGNHLLANAKALVFAGCFFSGEEAETWLRTGLDLLNAEWREQILDDGGHFELSPMYHAVILEDVLDLIQLARLFPAQLEAEEKSGAWRMLAGRMLSWLADMTHPDGEIAFFNDAAFGIARTRGELAEYATVLGVSSTGGTGGLRHLVASGYIRLQSGPFLAIFDAAEIGPSYLPGHGHADVLSLEVSLDGQRLVTNGGTSSYSNDTVRDEERSTAAHATVEIDSYNSSEVWASFRVGRRAHPFDVTTSAVGGEISAAASHDGYRWLPGKPVHHRNVTVSSTSLSVHDRITGSGNHSVIGRLPLHPSVISAIRERDGWRLELADHRVVCVLVEGCSDCFIEEGFYAPTFGQRMSRSVLAWRHEGGLPLNVKTKLEL